MCICLPNGKFNFKFVRSYPCLGKKDSKHKHNLTLIEESSEDEEIHNKPIISNGNGVKKDPQKITAREYENHQGHYRQLSRDRQLPPVPDAGEFPILQVNSLRKSSVKQKNKDSVNSGQENRKQNMEDYGSISGSETYGESKSIAQTPSNIQPGTFKLGAADEIKDVDPLYASVIPQTKRSEINEKSNNAFNYDIDNFLINNLNDHGYSIIKKKPSVNEFSSLRKPDRSKPAVKDHCHQSLQSLSNQAPGLPIRQYKQSELFHLMNNGRLIEPVVKLRSSHSSNLGSNSIRRFSQPPVPKHRSLSVYDASKKQDQDIFRSLQSAYNSPPINRASLTNVCHVDSNGNDSNFNEDAQLRNENRGLSNTNLSQSRESVDLYRRITVRESIASLRARNALPEDTTVLNCMPATTTGSALQHVYEGLYETLYYSSADNGRNGPSIEATRTRPPSLPQIHNPLPYLGQDNYLSITENPLALNFPNNSELVIQNSALIRPANDRTSIVYTAAGSDVYAEISDIYQSKQYEELPDSKVVVKSDGGGQINSAFVGCSSPGSVRVMLEIQSFRHMDSDVDISSRCTTPLHPIGKSIGNKSSQWKSHESNDTSSGTFRHPWYLPQKNSLPAQTFNGKSSSIPASANKPPVVKPKTPQSNLAIMTPVMERSMEGSSMFLDENKNKQTEIDCLYDLFKANKPNCISHTNVDGELRALKHFLHADSSPDENNFPSADDKTRAKRIIYPRFSGSDPHS